MAKECIAIDPFKNVYELKRTGLEELKRLHRAQGKTGWQYGDKEEYPTLLAKVITPKEAESAIAENARLKAEIEALKKGQK